MLASVPPRFDPGRRRAVTVALLLASALVSFEFTVVSTAMPTIIGDLAGLPLYAWVFAIYLLTSTVAMPLYGRLADVYGRRKLLLFSIGVFLVGAVACAFSRSMPQLIVARAIQGLGAAGLIPISLTVAADIYAVEERPRVQGLFSAVWGIAGLVGPSLGAFLTVRFGWRSIFAINVPLGIVAFAIVASQMIESRARLPEPIDVAGSLSLACGVTLLLFGVLHAPGGRIASATGHAVLLSSGIAVLFAFAWLQTRRAHPLIPPALFRRWDTASPYVSGMIVGTTIYGVDTFVPLFVQGAKGGTAASAGAVITPVILFSSISAALGASVILRFGFRATARLGGVLVVLGLGGLVAGVATDASVVWMVAACAVIGSGLGLFVLVQVLAVQHAAPEPQWGIATSLVPFFRRFGGSLGVGALGGIFATALSSRLGGSVAAAGRLLAGGRAGASGSSMPPGAPGRPEGVFRAAIQHSLAPVFVVLLGLAVLNLFVASRFPDSKTPRAGGVSTDP